VGTVRGVVELKNRTTEFPVSVPDAEAPVPPPPVKAMTGVDMYPEPGLVMVIVCTPPPRIVQVAVAPDPPPPEIVTVGEEVYPVPLTRLVYPVTYPETSMLVMVAVWLPTFSWRLLLRSTTNWSWLKELRGDQPKVLSRYLRAFRRSEAYRVLPTDWKLVTPEFRALFHNVTLLPGLSLVAASIGPVTSRTVPTAEGDCGTKSPRTFMPSLLLTRFRNS
jgi:hypothetical protein